MADVFLSYARADQTKADSIARSLESAGFSVWWDRHIRGGASYAKDIERELREARLVIVLWSEASCRSDWVNDEAMFARDRHVLLPVALDGVDQPLGFRQYQCIDLSKWRGAENAGAILNLLQAVSDRLGGADSTGKAAPPAIAGRRRVAVFAAFAAIGIAALVALATFRDKGAPKPPPAVASLAVLPFADMSPARDQGPIADGVAEQILNALGAVEGLSVSSRTSAFIFRDQLLPIGEIASRLDVRYVLEGSWFKAKDAVQVQARLIDAESDRPVWSEEYSRSVVDPDDLVRIQEDIANAVASALRAEFGMPEPKAVKIKVPTSNLSAYDLHLRARALYMTRRPENIEKSIALSEQAVALDPKFAEGFEQLGAVYAVARSYGVNGRDFTALAAEANAKALALDDRLSMPHAVIGLAMRAQYPTPWAASIASLKKAIARDARNADALLWLGMDYVALGYLKEAEEALTRCLAIDPSYANCRKNRAIARLALGKPDLAFEDAQQNVEAGFLRDADVYIPLFLARGDRYAAMLISGQINAFEGFPHEDFIDALATPPRLDPAKYAEVKALGAASDIDVASRSHIVLAFRAYDELNVERFGNAYENLWLPVFADFRKTERFKTLMRDLGHVDYWRKTGFPPQCRALSGDDFECG